MSVPRGSLRTQRVSAALPPKPFISLTPHPLLILPMGTGSPAWAPGGRGGGQRVLSRRRRLQARALWVQSRHPPCEGRGSRCASVVSMEICRPGNLDEPQPWPWELLSLQGLPRCKHWKNVCQPFTEAGASLLATGHPANQDTPKQGQICGGPDGLSGTTGPGSG